MTTAPHDDMRTMVIDGDGYRVTLTQLYHEGRPTAFSVSYQGTLPEVPPSPDLEVSDLVPGVSGKARLSDYRHVTSGGCIILYVGEGALVGFDEKLRGQAKR